MVMRTNRWALGCLALLGALAMLPATAVSDDSLSDKDIAKGFYNTVFGAEHTTQLWQTKIVKKYMQPVHFYVDNRAQADRSADVLAFLDSLPMMIKGLNIAIVDDPAKANFRIFIVDREQYATVARSEVYRQPNVAVPGRCLARVVSGRTGIKRSDAIIVADEGEFLFRRCLTEEILQGLGPVNDSSMLPQSVFNDTSKHSSFTRHDRYILNVLYDPRIRPGMSEGEVGSVLPSVIKDMRYVIR